MGFSCGIVGLPNVGKSTLFNALTRSQAAAAANYPFCTIDPNSGQVHVPDPRLAVLQKIAGTQVVIPSQLELVDIAGLVKGASEGAGKGNAFLSHIKGVDAILHVVRCFEDDNIIHVDGRLDPVRDIETIDGELILKDAETVQNKLDRLQKRRHDKDAQAAVPVLERVKAGFEAWHPARSLNLTAEELLHVADCQLITIKPMLFVCNVDETSIRAGRNAWSEKVAEHASKVGAGDLVISCRIEEELAQLADEDRAAFMQDLGLREPGLDRLVRAGYALLDLRTYFTAGEKEVRAWRIRSGWKAPQAAGVIHTDFEKNFIRAEVCAYDDYVQHNGEKGCKEAGRLRAEGKDYVVQDGDVMHFRHAG